MASKHTAHSGLHGPARIDQTKKNKLRREKQRAKIALKRAKKRDDLRILRVAAEAIIERAAITGIKVQDDSIAATA